MAPPITNRIRPQTVSSKSLDLTTSELQKIKLLKHAATGEFLLLDASNTKFEAPPQRPCSVFQPPTSWRFFLWTACSK
jgi:hypothetical protein